MKRQLPSIYFPTFEDYLRKFNKTYTDEEKLIREPLYLARLEVLRAVTEYTPAVNEFSDWTKK